MKTTILTGALAALALLGPANAQSVEPGFTDTALPFAPAIGAVSATLSTGSTLSFDGVAFERYSIGGVLQQTYGTLPGFTFASFLKVDTSETFAIAGESSNGELFRIDLVAGTATPLTTLPFNYDAAIASTGTVYVSAAAGAPGVNQIYAVDSTTGASTFLAEVPGFSGPIAVRSNGDVLIGVTDGVNRILSFAAADLAAVTPGAELGESDATLLSSGWTGLSWMIADQESNEVFIADSDFVNFVDPAAIHRMRGDKGTSPVVATAAPGAFYGGLEIVSSSSNPEVFREFQPETGGLLRYQVTDFFSFVLRSEIEPVRPTAMLSGPGVGGDGLVDYTVSGAMPNAVYWLFFGPSSLAPSTEVPLVFGGDLPTFFWGIDVGSQRYLPFLLPTDASGSGTFSFVNAGGALNGLIAFQSPIGDMFGNLLGSANAVQL